MINQNLLIKEFNSNKLFQMSHDYETENVDHRQTFWSNLFLKTIRDIFFPAMFSVIKGGMRWDMKESLDASNTLYCMYGGGLVGLNLITEKR